jgi:two-component system, cell cycle sensor histidine kinase and response regulator CckA
MFEASDVLSAKVLIVDDRQANVRLLELMLQGAGYVSVTSTVDPRLVCDLHRTNQYDLILLDLQMPGLDGFQVMRELREVEPEGYLPVLVVTAHADQRLHALQAGARDFISQPFDHLEALTRIHNMLEVRLLLRESRSRTAGVESRYRGLLEAAPDAMVVVNQAGEIVLLNVQAEKQFGYMRDELVGQRITNIIPEGFAERLRADGLRSTEDALAQQIGTGIELSARRKDGSEFPIEIMLSPLESSEGILVTAAIRNITARKVSEQRLRDSEEEYRLLFESNPHPMWVFDVETLAFLAVNDAAVRVYGFSKEEFLGMTIKEIRPPEEVAALLEYLPTMPAAPSLPAVHVKHRKKDGSLLEVVGHTSPIEFHGRRARLVLATDVTETKRLEAQLLQAQKMDAVGRLAGGVAHDFNNLLGVIVGYADLARRQLGVAHPVRGRIDEILKASERAAGLTRQLLAFSRRQVLQPKLLDLNEVIAYAEKMLGRLISEDIDIVVRPGPDIGTVRADRGQVEQIVLNLAVNARDAMPAGGSLTLETANVDQAYATAHPPSAPGHYVMLAVSDTGVGMDASTQAHIFEPFFTTKPEGEGTGLGLATVYGIVNQSGGHISVYSEPGRGTTFKVYLPRIDEPVERSGPVAPAEVPRGHETILVVEDIESLREVIRETLEESGYTVLLASNGEDALMLCRERAGQIDLLLTDVVMPKLGGGALARLLLALRPALRVLYMSGYSEGAISQHGILGEGVTLLEKPFSVDKLLRVVREALDRPPGETMSAGAEPTPTGRIKLQNNSTSEQ